MFGYRLSAFSKKVSTSQKNSQHSQKNSQLLPFYILDTIVFVWREIFGEIHGLRLITHLVKFLRKLSKIEGDKNFLKRGEVDVIYFRPLIIILLIFKDFSKL